MDCEVLIPVELRARQRHMLEAMLQASALSGIIAWRKPVYSASSKLLMTWGMGHCGRRSAINSHLRAGGHVIGWDLGYWDRKHQFRLTVDRDHPQMRDMPADRFHNSSIKLRDDADESGPIMLVGLGRKSRAALGYSGMEWEQKMFQRIRSAYPSARIIYRPKKPEPFSYCAHVEGEIEQALSGCSMVVCRHSNVAVDACIAGIPVVCEDGAAASLYSSDLQNPVKPDRSARQSFLQNLAWWQWQPTEAIQAWNFIKQTICA